MDQSAVTAATSSGSRTEPAKRKYGENWGGFREGAGRKKLGRSTTNSGPATTSMDQESVRPAESDVFFMHRSRSFPFPSTTASLEPGASQATPMSEALENGSSGGLCAEEGHNGDYLHILLCVIYSDFAFFSLKFAADA